MLNPIRAKVSLDLRVLTYQDWGLLSVGCALFMAHQVAKETMATISSWGDSGNQPGTKRIISSVRNIRTLPGTIGL